MMARPSTVNPFCTRIFIFRQWHLPTDEWPCIRVKRILFQKGFSSKAMIKLTSFIFNTNTYKKTFRKPFTNITNRIVDEDKKLTPVTPSQDIPICTFHNVFVFKICIVWVTWNKAPLDNIFISPPAVIKLGCDRLSCNGEKDS